MTEVYLTDVFIIAAVDFILIAFYWLLSVWERRPVVKNARGVAKAD